MVGRGGLNLARRGMSVMMLMVLATLGRDIHVATEVKAQVVETRNALQQLLGHGVGSCDGEKFFVPFSRPRAFSSHVFTRVFSTNRTRIY